MELTHQHTTSLFEELIMAPKIDTTNELILQNNWNFMSQLDQTPDFHFPITNHHPNSLLLDQFNFNPSCPFGELQPFLDALTSSQDQFGSFYDEYLPTMEIQENATLFLDNSINNATFDVGTTPMNVDRYGQKKTKTKKPDGQPSKNLMAERRRRKRLNDRLSMLRSIVPKISKMDRTSILGDTIDYTRELLDKIHKLREEERNDQIDLIGKGYLKDEKGNEMQQLRNPPKFEVERRNNDTRVEVCCTTKPGLLLSTLSTLDVLGLDIQQCVISCFNDFSLQASCYETPEQRSIVCSEDVKQALFRNAGYGGRCV